jgi:hypothetical protein
MEEEKSEPGMGLKRIWSAGLVVTISTFATATSALAKPKEKHVSDDLCSCAAGGQARCGPSCSKTDQDGAGRKIGIPCGSNPETCPVRTVQSRLEQVGADVGPLFRSISRLGKVRAARLSGIDVARIVKKLAVRVGLDPAK